MRVVISVKFDLPLSTMKKFLSDQNREIVDGNKSFEDSSIPSVIRISELVGLIGSASKPG